MVKAKRCSECNRVLLEAEEEICDLCATMIDNETGDDEWDEDEEDEWEDWDEDEDEDDEWGSDWDDDEEEN